MFLIMCSTISYDKYLLFFFTNSKIIYNYTSPTIKYYGVYVSPLYNGEGG